MKKIALILTILICSFIFVCTTAVAKTENIGVVNINKILENYTTAQEVTADLKVQEDELQKLVVDAKKQIKKAKTPLEKKNLEEKLTEQFSIKRNVYAKEQSEKWKKIENKVFAEIKKVAKNKKIDMVLNKQSVIIGGEDITDKVIDGLNKEAKKSK